MIALPVTEPSQVADVRRRALGVARGLGFDETASGRVGIVATELATNLVKFGTSGEILLGVFQDGRRAGVEMIALDKGPGLSNVGDAVRDGYSTAGTAGTGLGAIKRLCLAFEIVSWPRLGTAVLARVADVGKERGSDAPPAWGIVVVPLAGQTVSGDSICARGTDDGWTIFAADGLGHGPQAARAADEAIRLFLSVEHDPLPSIVAVVHDGMRHTRGAAVAVSRFSETTGTLRYVGIGNIESRIVRGIETERLLSHDGTAGLAMRRVQEMSYPFSRNCVLVTHSDGLTANWSPSMFPGIFAGHPSLAAAVLYRQCARGRDDASIVVATATVELAAR